MALDDIGPPGGSGPPVGVDAARYQLVVSAAEVGTFDWDMVADRLVWDDRLCHIFGVAPDDFGGSIAAFWDRVLPEDLADVAQELQASVERGGEFRSEYRIVRPDGTTRWVDTRGRVLTGADGRPVRMLGVARDSTELRLARDAVARALEHMADAFVALDPDWQVTYVNRPAAELIGAERDDVTGKQIWDVWPALRLGGHDRDLRRAAETGEAVVVSFFDADAGRWHQVRVVPAPEGVSLFATDVTAAHAAELERVREQARTEQANRVLAYSQALAEAETVDDITAVVATLILPAFEADGLLVSLADSGKLRLFGHAGYPDEAVQALDGLAIDANAPIAEVMRTQRPLFLGSLPDYLARYPRMGAVVALTGKQAWAFLPLTASGRALGSLTISFTEPRTMPPGDRSLAVSLAALLAQTLERARLRDAERGLAAELQRGLLPKDLPEVRGLAGAARYLPATDGLQVGGDWYELIRLSDDRVALVIGDVQGHHVHAASTMGQLRSALRAYAAEGHDAVAVLARSNRLMHDIDPDAFATCCYVEIDLAHGRATVVRAGHPPPLLRSSDGRTRWLEAPVGSPLGVHVDERYDDQQVELRAGDSLVLFTDGLVEDARTPIELGLAALEGVVRETDPRDLERSADAVVGGHAAAEHRPDDIAVLVVRYDGPQGC